jgi:hypothetical protein
MAEIHQEQRQAEWKLFIMTQGVNSLCIKWSEGNVKQKRRKVEGIQEAGKKEKGEEGKGEERKGKQVSPHRYQKRFRTRRQLDILVDECDIGSLCSGGVGNTFGTGAS